jgi:hypothetical protein
MKFPGVVWCVTICWLGGGVHAQVEPDPAPLADRVDRPLLPSGIWDHTVVANARLAHVFKDDEGTDVLHLIGEVVLAQGGQDKQTLRSREAVVWIASREHDGRPYRHLSILLWQDGEIRELGGTLTSGPALFVTLDTSGDVQLETDDVAFGPAPRTQVYVEGDRIRRAIEQGAILAPPDAVGTRVFDAAGLSGPPPRLRPKPIINFQTRGEVRLMTTPEGGRVLTASGGVYLSRAAPETASFFQVQADSVVVFLPAAGAARGPAGGLGPGSEPGLGGEPREPNDAVGSEGRRAVRAVDPDEQLLASSLGDVKVEGAYLEGDVVLAQGANVIRASRLYYDFLRERAIILDAVVRTVLAQRNIPLYVRAEQIRQLSEREFIADSAILTTSEFYTPHYHIGADRVELINRTPPDPTGRASGIRAGSFVIQHATLQVGGVPVLYWPYVRGQVATSETSIKSIRTGYSGDFGLELETQWHLFNVLGYETPEGFDGVLSLDYLSERGPAAGIDLDYKRDRYFGLTRSYMMHDEGEDFLGRERESPPPQDERGRFLLRHRQYLEEDWQLSLEVSYISDEAFLEEYFESEFDNGKEQETLLYLKKQRDNWAFTSLLQARILDFTTQTERLPDLAFHLAGESLHVAGSATTWFSENRMGMVRYRPAEQDFFDLVSEGPRHGSGTVARADTRQELESPVDVGPWRFVPFVSGRGTAWDDTPSSGGTARALGTVGVRGSSYLSRVYPEVRSEPLDVDGLRHVIKSDVVAWVASSNRDPSDLYPFDELIEETPEVDGVTFGRRPYRRRRGRGLQRHRRTGEHERLRRVQPSGKQRCPELRQLVAGVARQRPDGVPQ